MIGNLAVGSIRASANLLRLTTTADTLVTLASLASILAGVADRTGVAIVGVDTTQSATVNGNDVVDDNIAGTTIVRAVTAASGDFAIVFGVEILDLNSATSVELNDLVVCIEGTTSVNVGSTA